MKRLDRVHLQLLVRALRKHKGNKTHAANWLGISIRTLRNWEIKFKLRVTKAAAAWRPFIFKK